MTPLNRTIRRTAAQRAIGEGNLRAEPVGDRRERRWKTAPSNRPLSRIEQALRATDQLLQGGGFSAIVLDMGSITLEDSSRVPMVMWFRYRAAAEQTHASILLLTQHSCAKSSAELLAGVRLTKLEQIMETLWTKGEASIREMLEAFPDKKRLGYGSPSWRRRPRGRIICTRSNTCANG